MKKLNAIAIAVMFLASIFAGAFGALALDPVNDVKVNAYNVNGAKLTVDTITVYDDADKEIGLARNVQSHTFLLSAGTYTIVAEKTGYDLADAWVPVNADKIVNLKLASTTGEPTGGTDETDGPTQQETTSQDVYVSDLDFDEDSKPAANVEFELEVETVDVEDFEAEDIEATLIVVGLDEGDDVEVEDVELDDMDEDESQTIKINLNVPIEAEEGEYTVKVYLTWKDDTGTKQHNLEYAASDKLSIERAEHDVQITKLQLSTETLQPGDEAELGVTLMNIGEEDEKVKVRVKNEKLSISETSAEFELEEGDEITQYIPFAVPEDAENGKYSINVIASFNDGADETLQIITVGVSTGTITGAAVTVTPTVTVEDAETGWTSTGLLIAVIVLIGVIAVLAKEYAPKRPVVVAGRRRR